MKTESINEKNRIDTLLQNGRITKEDHQILVAALERKESFLKKVLAWSINPFQGLSTTTSILIGCISILAMSFIGTSLGLHFRGALDFQIIEEGKRTFSFVELLTQNIVDVLCVSAIFYVGALICRCKNLRFIDFISSIVFSRFPYAVFALVLFVLGPVFPGLLPRKVETHDMGGTLALAIIGITFLVWEMTLIFSSLKESSGMKDKQLWVTFIIGLIFAEAASYALNNLIIK